MENVWLVEKDGKRRKGKKQNCLVCNKEFITRINSDVKQCSKECGHKSRQIREVVECAACNKKFEKTLSQRAKSKSGFYFCSRVCKDESQRLGGIQEIMPFHYGSAQSREIAKRFIRGFQNPSCVGCKNSDRYLLAVHHKDGNSFNNVDENFEIVCANCHIKRHLKLVDGKWIYDTKHLTPRDMLDFL